MTGEAFQTTPEMAAASRHEWEKPMEKDEALRAALEHVVELRDAWERGALTSRDGLDGPRSNRNVDVETTIRTALAAPADDAERALQALEWLAKMAQNEIRFPLRDGDELVVDENGCYWLHPQPVAIDDKVLSGAEALALLREAKP